MQFDKGVNDILSTIGKALQSKRESSQSFNLVNIPLVIYESTVYPGATEEVCIPILEKESLLKFNSDFFCGYSPERIIPGDKHHNIESVIKITSGLRTGKRRKY